MAKVRQEIDSRKLYLVVDESPILDKLLYNEARDISNKAQEVFRARQVTSNEWRLSETTPPKYVRSFQISKIRLRGTRYAWIMRNVDPAAAWVEYGAHAGGRTFVLRYYPLKTALMAQGIAN